MGMICYCCGSEEMEFEPVLWPELIAAWQLSNEEVRYIDRQQGTHCGWCLCNLRTMALATAVMRCSGFDGLFKDFVRSPAARGLRLLEINEAGNLTPYLEQLPGHLFAAYPDVDMLALPYPDATFDLVVHSDTLEHVPGPIAALAECGRVLKPGGFCAFTVPIVVRRLTQSRAGMPPSYHGSPANPSDCLVHTEYGADAWADVIRAGFAECRVVALEYPAALALVGVKAAAPAPTGRGPDAVGGPEALRLAAKDLAAVLPPTARLILVDDDQLPVDWAGGRPVIPFLERDGTYHGSPPDGATAVRELERLRDGGAEFVAFAWPSFWWLIIYAELRRHLRGGYRCILENDRLLVFDMRERQEM